MISVIYIRNTELENRFGNKKDKTLLRRAEIVGTEEICDRSYCQGKIWKLIKEQ